MVGVWCSWVWVPDTVPQSRLTRVLNSCVGKICAVPFAYGTRVCMAYSAVLTEKKILLRAIFRLIV